MTDAAGNQTVALYADGDLVKLLDKLIKSEYRTATAFLKEIAPVWKGTSSTLSKIRSGDLGIPDPLRRWLLFKAPFGTVFVEEEQEASPVLRALRYMMEQRDYEGLIFLSSELIESHRVGRLSEEGPELLPRLLAFRGVGYRAIGCRWESLRSFRKAAEVARQSALRLYPRYRISSIVWESELTYLSVRRRRDPRAGWDARLRKLNKELSEIKTVYPEDGKLRLQALMRNASRLDDRKGFDAWLAEARKHAGFGETPEKRDSSLRFWMSENEDADGDFKNARSYQSYSDLF